jgi:pyroglutamyl-peptidase
MASRRALLTGFEPYGGRGTNPAYEVMRALDGREIAGVAVVGRALPVSYQALRERIVSLLDEVDPVAVLSLGLWPGEPMIRLERMAANVADFEIADNDGRMVTDGEVVAGGALGVAATLPLREIEKALLGGGIPVRISGTAGSFLCNACLYHFLDASASRVQGPAVGPLRPACGFMHLPYLPSQVAELLAGTRREGRYELHQRADLASMELATATRAAEMALAVTLASAKAG